MADPLHPAVGAQQQVTSSDLVRRFGLWQERATRAPVYVIHRGRPRLVLVSLDIMDALCAAAPPADRDIGEQALADTLPQPTLLIAPDGNVRYANGAARVRYGSSLMPGASPAAMSRGSGAFLVDAVSRVLASGIAETVEIVPDRYPSRVVEAAVTASPGGCVVRLDDASRRAELADSRAAQQALAEAIGQTGHAAFARIGPRGVLVAPSPALAALTGTTTEQLATARFVTLLDVADRPLAGERIDAAFIAGEKARVSGSLLVRGAAPVAVSIGFSPLRLAGRIEEVVAAIVPAQP